MPTISIIAAMASNRVIGINNTLPWHIPADLKHFKKLTMGHTMIMGRKTFESIGKPLPGRETLIISRQPDYAIPGCQTCQSLEQALSICAGKSDIFIVGGADIYQQMLPQADRLFITEVQQDFDGDVRFPEIDPDQWREVQRIEQQQQTPQALNYHFVTYQRTS